MTELLAAAVVFFFVVIIAGLVREQKKVRREMLDDDIPGFDDWKFGTPDDPLPEDAQPLNGEGRNPNDNVLKGPGAED